MSKHIPWPSRAQHPRTRARSPAHDWLLHTLAATRAARPASHHTRSPAHDWQLHTLAATRAARLASHRHPQ
eukprot:5679562-Prymnesium_polylepis.1